MINQEKINLDGKGNGLKVIVVSDLHLGLFSSEVKLKRAVKRINELEGDLVLIPGDFVFKLPVEKFSEFSELKNIKLPLAVVLGNHDNGRPRGTDVSTELVAALTSNGIRVIDNKVWDLEIKGKKIKVVGLNDYYSNDANFMLLRKDSPDQLLISLTHNPDTSYQYPTNSQADITISGHTHGGQIRLPWLYKSAIPSDYSFDAGLYHVGNYPVFVSSGFGTVGLPMRFFRLPEINVLELN
ncbi:MAG: metallophosphoesterase [Candidatus Falkowbacteria bacterium]